MEILTGNIAYIALNSEQKPNAEKIIQNDEYDISQIGWLTNENGEDALIWKTDLAGLFRIQAQMVEEGTSKWVGYSFCYVVLILFTLFFAVTYMKRVLYMAFLTIIAPLVAMTYPIDKITDGKAQAFNSWLREYIFNLMIQPLHLLLYTILVSSAYVLATESPIYALVAIGFMMPAEQLMRKFFGFEKAKTPGLLGGAAGAAVAMSGLQGILKRKPGGGKTNSENAKSEENNKVRFSNKNKGNAMDDMTGMKAVPGKNSAVPKTQNAPNINVQSNQEVQNSHPGVNQGQRDDIAIDGIEQGHSDNDEDVTQFDLTADSDNIEETSEMDDANLSVNVGQEEAISKLIESSATGAAENAQKEIQQQGHKRSILRAVGAATLGVGKRAGKQLATGVLTGIHPLKLAGRVAGGLTAATAGLLIGTASGDPSKAFQYTTTGAMAGSAFAGSLSGKITDTEQIKQDYEMAYYGPDYKEKVIEKEKKDFQENSENINYLRQVMGVSHSEAKEILETTGGDCFDNGITDIKDVATIHQLTHPKDEKDKMSFEKAAAARTYAKRRLGGVDAAQMTDDKVREYKARWSKEFMERYKISEKQANKLAEQSFDAAIRFNKTYSDLTKF